MSLPAGYSPRSCARNSLTKFMPFTVFTTSAVPLLPGWAHQLPPHSLTHSLTHTLTHSLTPTQLTVTTRLLNSQLDCSSTQLTLLTKPRGGPPRKHFFCWRVQFDVACSIAASFVCMAPDRVATPLPAALLLLRDVIGLAETRLSCHCLATHPGFLQYLKSLRKNRPIIPSNWGCIFLRNTGEYEPHYTESNFRR
jgi:hypothetical protein